MAIIVIAMTLLYMSNADRDTDHKAAMRDTLSDPDRLVAFLNMNRLPNEPVIKRRHLELFRLGRADLFFKKFGQRPRVRVLDQEARRQFMNAEI